MNDLGPAFTFPVHYSAAMKIQRNDYVLGFSSYWLLDCEHNKVTYVNPDMQPPRYQVRPLKCDWHFIKTNETRNILGYNCTVWIREDRTEVCQTETGMLLMQKLPNKVERIAISVSVKPQDPVFFRVPDGAIPFEETQQGR